MYNFESEIRENNDFQCFPNLNITYAGLYNILFIIYLIFTRQTKFFHLTEISISFFFLNFIAEIVYDHCSIIYECFCKPTIRII